MQTSQEEKSYHANKIVEYALQCARIKYFNSYIENNAIHRLSRNDIEMYIEQFKLKVEHEALILLELMTLEPPKVDV